MISVHNGLILILTDYPLKSMAYQNLCKAYFPNLNIITATNPNEIRDLVPDMVLVDLNVMPKDEPKLRVSILDLFSRSNILLMEEDHEKIEIDLNNAALFITVGKRLEQPKLQAVLEMLASFSVNLANKKLSLDLSHKVKQTESGKLSLKTFLQNQESSALS